MTEKSWLSNVLDSIKIRDEEFPTAEKFIITGENGLKRLIKECHPNMDFHTDKEVSDEDVQKSYEACQKEIKNGVVAHFYGLSVYLMKEGLLEDSEELHILSVAQK